jgi:hypothetical protein
VIDAEIAHGMRHRAQGEKQQDHKPGDERCREDLHGFSLPNGFQEGSTGAAKGLDGLKFAIQNFP